MTRTYLSGSSYFVLRALGALAGGTGMTAVLYLVFTELGLIREGVPALVGWVLGWWAFTATCWIALGVEDK